MQRCNFLYIGVPSLDTVPLHGDLKYSINHHGHIMAFTAPCLETLLGLAGLSVVRCVAGDGSDLKDRKRMRVLAQKCPAPSVLPAAPIGAAKRAIRDYRVRFLSVPERLQATLLPVRLRASWQEGTQARKLLA